VGIVLVNLQGSTTAHSSSPPPSAATSLGSSEQAKTPPLFANEYLSLLSIFLAFGAASLSGIQTFFNFHKAAEGHRAVANRYLHISRQCKTLQQKHRDLPFTPDVLWSDYEKLYGEYNQINIEAEAFPTSSSDLAKAKKAQEISPYENPHAKQA